MDNVFRVVTAAAIGFTLTMSVGILAVYFRRVPWHPPRDRLLESKPFHISLLAASFSLFTAGIAIERLQNLGAGWRWQAWYYTIPAALSAIGQLALYRFERREHHHGTTHSA